MFLMQSALDLSAWEGALEASVLGTSRAGV